MECSEYVITGHGTRVEIHETANVQMAPNILFSAKLDHFRSLYYTREHGAQDSHGDNLLVTSISNGDRFVSA